MGDNIKDYPLKAEIIRVGTIQPENDGGFSICNWRFGTCLIGIDLREQHNPKVFGYTLNELKTTAKAHKGMITGFALSFACILLSFLIIFL